MVDISTPLEPAPRVAVEPLPADHPPGSPAPTPSSGDPGTGHRPVTARPVSEGGRRGAISVVVVDDHAAVRLGLDVAISSRRGLVCVGAVPDGELLPALLYRVRPDVVVLDYELPQVNGLELCRRIKADVPAPAVVLYSAYAGEALTIPALVAGVDAMVHKGTPARELFTAIEAVAGGEKQLRAPVPELFQAAAGAIDPADRPLLELLLNQAPRPEIGARLALSAAELSERVHRILDRLARRAR
jgi:DNA-binding NarL/FixJ family response regulator